MRKIILGTIAMLLLATANFSVQAQNTEPKKPEKEEKTTIDAWRGALPTSEEPYYKTQGGAVKKGTESSEDTPADIEKKIIVLEQSFISAHQERDSAAFSNLLSEDFIPVGTNLSGAKPNKARYITWALKDSELQSYVIEKVKVRVYGITALATVVYKKPAAADSTAVSNLTATDVWVRNGTQWQMVSRQTSSTSNP